MAKAPLMSSLFYRTLCLLLLIPGPLLAQATDKLPLDAVLILDSSGSMKTTDPRELRKPAAKLFITLLGPQDRISVMSFSDNAYPITFLSGLDDANNEKRALQATDKVSSKGMLTNIHAALARGIELLKDSHAQNREPIIVLMSDGKLDVGNAQQSAELRQKIQSELLPALKAGHIKVYSIAFTDQSDQTLLQQVADDSGGAYALAETDDSLHKAFSKIFESSKEPNLLPLTENQFVVDASIREITLIANKKSEQSKIFLESPTGERYNAGNVAKNMQWFVSTGFDMITLTKPAEGLWKILFSDNDNKAYIIADVELRTRFSYDDDPAQQGLKIASWFKKDKEVVKENEFLTSLELKLEIAHPDGQIETLAFPAASSEGEFISHFKPTQNGIYAATVIATSKTFQRQQFFSFRASLPQQKPLAAEPKTEPAPTPPPPAVETPPAEQDDVMQTVLIFVIGNIVLLLIGVNVYFFMKMKKSKPQASADESKK